jgi:acetoin utilization deacetylase AcuC-like enzyme
MLVAYDPIFAHPLPEGHRFPMVKYELIPEQLLREGIITTQQIHQPKPASEETILLTHDLAYWNKLQQQTLSAKEERKIGLPQSPALTLREITICQGSIDCALYALKHNSVALNIAGGTHHAFFDRGEGFCLLNDFGVAANYLLSKQLVKQVLVIDLDVHQGNGTASLFTGNPQVYTFSMHGEHNYPFHKEVSDWDVPLPDGMDDAAYLQTLAGCLPELIDKVQPDIVFYLSGVDILFTDRFGKLKVTTAGCRQRDEMVFKALKANNIPCAVAMGGGYSVQIKDIVNAHCNTFKVAAEVWE